MRRIIAAAVLLLFPAASLPTTAPADTEQTNAPSNAPAGGESTLASNANTGDPSAAPVISSEPLQTEAPGAAEETQDDFDAVEWMAKTLNGMEHVRFELRDGTLYKHIDRVKSVGSKYDDSHNADGVVTKLTFDQQHNVNWHQLRDQSGWGVRASYEDAMDVLLLADRATPRVPHNIPRPEDLPGGTGEVLNLDAQTFNEYALDERMNVLVRFCAPWNGFCKAMNKRFHEVAAAFKGTHDVIIADIDGDKYPEVAKEQNVKGYPTVLFYSAEQKFDPFLFNRAGGWSGLENFVESHRHHSHAKHRLKVALKAKSDNIERQKKQRIKDEQVRKKKYLAKMDSKRAAERAAAAAELKTNAASREL